MVCYEFTSSLTGSVPLLLNAITSIFPTSMHMEVRKERVSVWCRRGTDGVCVWLDTIPCFLQ
jgi:hypothetical protein